MAASDPDSKKQLLRHTLATLAYRGGKAMRGVPDSFSSFRSSETTRTPGGILAHIGDLLDWALSMARGTQVWRESEPQSWAEDTARFHAALARLDEHLAAPGPLSCPCEMLFQGPVADALTHVGQIAMLRRMAGFPVRGENYAKADIVAGRVGAEQASPGKEFD
jgi:hypothetical protein